MAQLKRKNTGAQRACVLFVYSSSLDIVVNILSLIDPTDHHSVTGVLLGFSVALVRLVVEFSSPLSSLLGAFRFIHLDTHRKQHVQLEFSRVRLQALALLLTVLRNSIQFNTLQSFIL